MSQEGKEQDGESEREAKCWKEFFAHLYVKFLDYELITEVNEKPEVNVEPVKKAYMDMMSVGPAATNEASPPSKCVRLSAGQFQRLGHSCICRNRFYQRTNIQSRRKKTHREIKDRPINVIASVQQTPSGKISSKAGSKLPYNHYSQATFSCIIISCSLSTEDCLSLSHCSNHSENQVLDRQHIACLMLEKLQLLIISTRSRDDI